jgi:hypothetical protein
VIERYRCELPREMLEQYRKSYAPIRRLRGRFQISQAMAARIRVSPEWCAHFREQLLRGPQERPSLPAQTLPWQTFGITPRLDGLRRKNWH